MDQALAHAEAIADACAAGADAIDHDGGFPSSEFRLIAEAGLLAAPLAPELGGLGLGVTPGRARALLRVLERLGQGNLAVGRVYEGHVNALQLIQTFGTPGQAADYAADARDRHLRFGVWNTYAEDGVTISPLGGGRWRLDGCKVFCSGAGHIERALVTGELAGPDPRGWQMCVVPMDQVRVDIDRSWWQPLGMRATASYRVDFGGVELPAESLIGKPGDYYREPWFSGGAARFAAVQLGGARALFDGTRAYLRELGRADDPHQRARVGEMAIAIAGGNLWLGGAADAWDRLLDGDAEAVVLCADMARLAIERICLETIALTERSVGARGLLRPRPFERIVRDLTIYLRQPAPDVILDRVGRRALEAATPPEGVGADGRS